MVGRLIVSSILQIWYVEVRISRSIWQSPFEFEIRIVDCTVFDLITAHTPISAQSSNSVVFRLQPVYFFLPLYSYKSIYCGYSFELHRLVDAIQMSTHNICIYKENQKKKSHNHHQISLLWSFYSVSLVGRYIFYHKWVFPVILKNLSTQCGN